MPEQLPDKLVLPTRDELVAQYLADMRFRAPQIAIAQGELANLDAALVADAVLPIYAEAYRQSETVGLDGMTGAELEQAAVDLGLPARLPAVGASGYVIADTSAGGAYIPEGTICRHPDTGARYRCVLSRLYSDGETVPVVGVTTGPSTNQAAGTILQWESPPPGLGVRAEVFRAYDGSGLTGGADAETDEELRARIRRARANPAASGNDAAYQRAVESTPGVAVEAAYTYPCISGPGTTAVAFTVRSSGGGGSRIPNAAQIALVRAWVIGQMPHDDSASFCGLVAEPTHVVLRVRWANHAARWSDASPWPPYDTDAYIVSSSPTPTSTVFGVQSATSSPVAPKVGQTIALWDRTMMRYVRKRIGAVSGANPWTITVDQTYGGSDLAYAPSVGDPVSPWSDSLQTIADQIGAYFASLGPGEQVSSPHFADGYRQRRHPPPPSWPYTITSKLTLGVEQQLSIVESVVVASPSIPLATSVGTPGVLSRLRTMGHLSILPL